MKELFDEERVEEKYFEGLYGRKVFLSNQIEDLFDAVTSGSVNLFCVVTSKVLESGNKDYPFKYVDSSGEEFNFKYCYVRK